MVKLQKSIHIVAMIGVACACVTAVGYKIAAENNLLNEQAMNKYKLQAKNGSGPIALIMHGRSEFFVGLMACLEHPVFGCGPWAIDTGKYWERFVNKYGDADDVRIFNETRAKSLATESHGAMLIPSHSFIIQFWLWFGILGVFVWIYFLAKFVSFLRRYIVAIPNWFGYLALGAPTVMWSIVFSPYANRFYFCMYVTCILLAIAVGKKRLLLPRQMINECLRHY